MNNKVATNGFGRVGRYLVRACNGCDGIEIKASNTREKPFRAATKKVIMVAPGHGVDGTFVMGVNEDTYNPNIISDASCAIICLPLVANSLNDECAIVKGLVTQRPLDRSHKDLRGAKAAATNEWETKKFIRGGNTSLLVTLFDDIENSAQLRRIIGEVKFQELRKYHDSSLSKIIRKDNEGEIIKFLGDGIFAVFFRPSVAVERALEIQEEFHEHPYLKVRLGIDMGELTHYATKGNPKDFFGPAVDSASRIMSMASGGHILVSGSVFRESSNILRKGSARWKSHGLYKKKQVDIPIEVHEPYNTNIPTKPMKCIDGIKS